MSNGSGTNAKVGSKLDSFVPLGIIGIVLMMVLPVPPVLLDVFLACSLALGIAIFLTALFIQEALEFSSFPALVLVATLLRLSLNVATTRAILLHGGEGQGSAGDVVEAFGRFVVEGNVVVGLVVFLILVVINFVVVTKGAGRVAEVAARFTLDAMPGKQMAVDADLSAGAITADQARARRKNLEREADFFGAMDGASKFVHGDAIAGLLITAINLIGGLVLGVSRGMDIATAGETFSILSVGDALATQIPALLVSAAAGIVVTRSATGGDLGAALRVQLLGRRRPVMFTAGILALMSLVPGMPLLPLLALSGTLFFIARKNNDNPVSVDPVTMSRANDLAPNDAGTHGGTKSEGEEVDQALSLDVLTIEVGYELVIVVDETRGGTLLSRVSQLRQQVAKEMGVIVPAVHVCDNLELPPSAYRVLILGNEVASGMCRTGRMLAMSANGSAPPIEGDPGVDPAFGLPAKWILERDREIAQALGCTVVDHPTVLATHLAEIIRTNAHKLLGRQEVQHLLDLLAKSSPKLVDDVVPALLPLGDVLRVLKNLLREGVSIRDMRTILESLAELTAQTKDVEQLTEMLRERLAPQISARHKSADGSVAAMTLSPHLEEALRQSLRGIAQGTGGPPDPGTLRAMASTAEDAMGQFSALSATPLVICAPDLRRFVRAIFERRLPEVAVVSFRELDPSLALKSIATLSLPSVEGAAA